MRALRIIGNILIGIVLFGLIFTLTFVRSTKNFLEKDIILGVIKDKITETIQEESGKISDKSSKLLDDMLSDNSSSDIIRMVIDNFDSYQNDRLNFKVSDADVQKIVNYASKYKETIIELSRDRIKDLSDEEFKKLFSAENINKLANEIFESINTDLGDGIDIAINVYSKATSSTMLLIFIGSILFMIILLLLINWSFYKWTLVTGIDLIISGIFIGLVYIAGLFFNDIIVSVDTLKKAIGEIHLTGYLIWGIIEIILGIMLIVVYSLLKNKNDDTAKKLNDL